MSSYRLKEKDYVKKNKEFSKTPFGRRAKIFSVLPLFVCIFCILGCVISFVVDENSYIGNMFILGGLISYVGGCITQLQYGNMLKEYIDSSK